jgi:hypothetical protein
MTIGAGGNYGNLTNTPGSLGDKLLKGREQADVLGQQVSEEVEKSTDSLCTPNLHDIFSNFPRWIRERNSETNLPEFLQSYYDWLYCKGSSGAQYYVSSKDYFDLLNLETNSKDIVRSYASSYAADFPVNKIGNSGPAYQGGENKGVSLDNIIDFLGGIRNNFYQTKGSEKSYKYFFKKLYGITLGENAIDYPKKRVLRLNGGRFDGWSRGVSAGGTGTYESTSTLGGSYLNDAIIQDGYFYQDYSYILNSGEVSDYDTIVSEMIHPAGLKVFYEQSFADYIPIGGSGDYSEGLADGCEVPRLYNYFPYSMESTGDIEPCVGCSGSGLWTDFWVTKRGLTGLAGATYTQPAFNHPGWALAGATTGSSGDIDTYGLSFSSVVIRDFVELCAPVVGQTSPNDGITSCVSGSDDHESCP